MGSEREAVVTCHFSGGFDETFKIFMKYWFLNAQKRELTRHQADIVKIMLESDKYRNYVSYIAEDWRRSDLSVFRVWSDQEKLHK
jgi:hypothetical protein